MKIYRAFALALAGLSSFGAASAWAADTVPSPDVPGWAELADAVRNLPAQLLAKLPEDRRSDPQVQQEVARLAMQSLAVSLLDSLAGDGDHPMFVPNQNLLLNFPMPNADTVYRTARITPGGTYRLRGERGSLKLASMVQIGGKPGTSGPPRVPLDLGTLHVDGKGHFDLLLSLERPAGYKGDWWPLGATTNMLLLRSVSAAWGKERDPAISIERTDVPARSLRPTAEQLEHRLRAIPRSMAVLPLMFVGHNAQLGSEGYVNRLKAYDLSQSGGLSGQSYYEGVFDIGENEALLIEAKAPKKCDYWSIILGNDLHQTLDWANNYSSLNNLQGKADSDGVLRFVVADRDPGIRNWLDTAGHRHGVVQGRWLGCDSNPVPSVRKVSLGELRSLLPHDTPEITPAQREASVRERRAAILQRSFW